jgi:hypothetical protein
VSIKFLTLKVQVTMAEKNVNPEVQEEAQVQEKTLTVETPANTAERTPREMLYERIRTTRPSDKYDNDEEEYSRQAMSMLDDLEGKAGQYDEMSKKLSGRFNQNPEEASAFLAYLDGASLPSAIRRYMGDDALMVKEGDAGWDEYQKAGKEREEQFASNRAALEQYMSNAKASDAAMEEFIKEAGFDESGAQNFKDVVLSIVNDMSAGKVSKETLALLKHAVDYEKDVEGAHEQGRVDGRNEKINAEKKRMEGSGLPNAHAGGNATKEIEVKDESNPTVSFLKGVKRF